MFGRKKSDEDTLKGGSAPEELDTAARPSPRPVPAARPPVLPPRPTGDAARPAGEIPRRLDGGTVPASGLPPRRESEIRKLIVGREISLAGEITSCDRLVVEGSVEANLANCRDIEISESGVFKGSASIEDAEIRGRFEGSLTVRRRLLIRATGRVSGTVRYGQIEIECGGQLSGDVQSQPSNAPPEVSEPAGEKTGEGGIAD